MANLTLVAGQVGIYTMRRENLAQNQQTAVFAHIMNLR